MSIQTPAIDFEQLARARGGPLAQDASLESVLADIPAECEALCEAVAANDAASVVRVSDRLRRSANGIGAVQLSTLCARLHALGQAGDLHDAEDLAIQLVDGLNEVWNALGAHLGGPTGAGIFGLTPEQHDALMELFNIGAGRSAAMLNGLAGQRIVLTTPELILTTPEDSRWIPGLDSGGEICVVEQDYAGAFSGRVSLLFSPEDGDTLARLLADGDDECLSPQELHALKMETLDEVGNVLVNALMGSISTVLGETLTYSVPECSELPPLDIFDATAGDDGASIRFSTRFAGGSPDMQGSFVICVNVDDISRFLASLTSDA